MVVVVATPQLEFSSPEVESVSADGLDKSYTGLLKLRAETGGIWADAFGDSSVRTPTPYKDIGSSMCSI